MIVTNNFFSTQNNNKDNVDRPWTDFADTPINKMTRPHKWRMERKASEGNKE